MSLSRRRRRAAAVRLVVFAILALALLLRPTLSSLAEVHEFAHDPSGQHQDLDAIPGQASDGDEGGQSEGQAGDALHTLVHFAHCCGQVSTDFPLQTTSLVFLLTADPPASADREDIPRTRLQTLFRPPITA